MPDDAELRAEIDDLRRQLAKVKAEVALNEKKMHRSQRREFRMLMAENLGDLFGEMIDGLQKSYRLQCVSVVISDPNHHLRHLLLAEGAHATNIENLIIVDSIAGLAPQYATLRQPWLGPYAASDHQMIFPPGQDLGSIAIIPLANRRRLFGSINLGSRDAARFTAEHASHFLAHMGVIAAYCIENVINRARLLRSGFTDVLTGWHNRRYLQVRLKEELARVSREGKCLVCLMLDVDHFKRVNDTWGHAAGDAVLRELAQRIESQVRKSDVAARYGGEEFVVLLPDTSTSNAELLAQRIRNAVSASPFPLPGGESVAITASIGIASVAPRPQAKDLKRLGDSLIARADVALYRAKRQGRDRVVVGEAA